MCGVLTTRAEVIEAKPTRAWAGRVLAVGLPLIVSGCRDWMRPWVFMWCLSFAIFAGLKWLTWWNARTRVRHARWRSAAYLLAWPGMDAETFLRESAPPEAQSPREWLWAALKTAIGAALIWLVARAVPAHLPLARGWIGMLGLIFLLHFGSFHLVALFWQRLGVNARPIMLAPIRSTSLAEFWGKRWNLGFRQLSHALIFRPLQRKVGAGAASLAVFAASGLIHEAVISLPARGGYGLPSAYFLLQGLGVAAERSVLGQRLRLRAGPFGWIFTFSFTAGPVFLLFHPPFVLRAILPLLEAIHA
jgi:hypothetical protein